MFNNKNSFKTEEDKYFKDLFVSIEKDCRPPKKFKDELFVSIMAAFDLDTQKLIKTDYSLSDRIFFEKPWRFAIPLSIIVSIILKLITGNVFEKFIFSFFAGI